MEAKTWQETVISDREIKSVLLKVADVYYDAEIQVTVSHTAVARAQAEISFKAGQREGFLLGKNADFSLLSDKERDACNKAAEEFLEAVKQEGRREVVEWIEEHSSFEGRTHWNEDNLPAIWETLRVFHDIEWQAKLKEWEVEK